MISFLVLFDRDSFENFKVFKHSIIVIKLEVFHFFLSFLSLTLRLFLIFLNCAWQRGSGVSHKRLSKFYVSDIRLINTSFRFLILIRLWVILLINHFLVYLLRLKQVDFKLLIELFLKLFFLQYLFLLKIFRLIDLKKASKWGVIMDLNFSWV